MTGYQRSHGGVIAQVTEDLGHAEQRGHHGGRRRGSGLRREQQGWPEHAARMDESVEGGFIVLGGPIGDGSSHRILLIVEAIDMGAVTARLTEDPWLAAGRLTVALIEL